MATIQEVGREILSGQPSKFYVFCGSEYGLKEAYIDKLKAVYPSYKEADTVASVLAQMEGVHLIPLQPTLYIIR